MLSQAQRVTHTFQARRALLRSLAPRYQQATSIQKTLLLDAFVEWTGYTRKYAIALLNHGELDQLTIQRHRMPQYCPEVQQALFLAWKATHYVCAKRLLPSLPSLVAVLERLGHLRITEEERRQLLAMSLSTAERYLRTQHKPRLHGLSTTTPGPWSKTRVPVLIFSPWEEKRPGFVEIDLVAHCGDHLDGRFLYTLTLTDLATCWTECIPLLSKSADTVLDGLEQARALFPFPLLGIDTDSGTEFLNTELIAYCEREQLTFMHGHAEVKNDQAHVEQKNGAVVREAVGYTRLEGRWAYQQLREVYQALRLVVNCFQPSLKLQSKIQAGERVRRVYDAAQTPLQRLLATGVLPEDRQRDLSAWVQHIDPLMLSEHLDALRLALGCVRHLPPAVAADGRVWPPLRFSLVSCPSNPMAPSEEGPERRDPQEALARSEEIRWTSGSQTSSRVVSTPMEEVQLPTPSTTCPPQRAIGGDRWPSERSQGDLSESRPREPHPPDEIGSEACPSAVLASPLPASPPEMLSRSAGEPEATQFACITVEQAIAAYVQDLRTRKRLPKTLQWHHISLSSLRRYLWREFRLTDVAQLSQTCLQSWVTDLPILLSARTGTRRTINTVASYARSARAFCNWLTQRGYVAEPLFPTDAIPQAPQRVPQLVEPNVFVRLLHACQLPGSPEGLNAGLAARNRAILWLLQDTGLQVSELGQLRLEDVDHARGTVTVQGKGGHIRTFPLSADGQRAVCAYVEQARLTPTWEPAVPEARDRLLLTKRRYPVTKTSFTQLFQRLNQRAGITKKPICPSMLRDTYAIRFLQAGGDLATLQKQLGIAGLVSVKRYQRFCAQARGEGSYPSR